MIKYANDSQGALEPEQPEKLSSGDGDWDRSGKQVPIAFEEVHGFGGRNEANNKLCQENAGDTEVDVLHPEALSGCGVAKDIDAENGHTHNNQGGHEDFNPYCPRIMLAASGHSQMLA